MMELPAVDPVEGHLASVFNEHHTVSPDFGVTTARRFRISGAFGLSFHCGYLATALIACHGVLSWYGGRVTWNGRTYDLHRRKSPGTVVISIKP
jgi:hypothetical protein